MTGIYVPRRGMKNKKNPNRAEKPTPLTGIVDTAQLTAVLRVNRKTIWDWRDRGIIPYFKIGRSVRFDLEAVLNQLRAKCQVGGTAQ